MGENYLIFKKKATLYIICFPLCRGNFPFIEVVFSPGKLNQCIYMSFTTALTPAALNGALK